MFPKPLIMIGIVVLLAAWFFVGERQNYKEKLFILIALPLLYIGFRMVTGSTIEEIMFPIQQFLAR